MGALHRQRGDRSNVYFSRAAILMSIATRHYIGKTVEADHVVIDERFRSQRLGKKLFDWIHEYKQSKGCGAIELNTYVENRKSHKFYYNLGYEIYGFHMLNILRDDKKFY
jgi:GNAT superfamily N-acetyltransferase